MQLRSIDALQANGYLSAVDSGLLLFTLYDCSLKHMGGLKWRLDRISAEFKAISVYLNHYSVGVGTSAWPKLRNVKVAANTKESVRHSISFHSGTMMSVLELTIAGIIANVERNAARHITFASNLVV